MTDTGGGTDPLFVQWKNPEFLAYLAAQKGAVAGVGGSPLDEANVMEYFSTSPFYDRHSNNEHVRMQSAALIAQTAAEMPQSGPELMRTIAMKQQEELACVVQQAADHSRFVGLEFVLVHARAPSCFVIHKRWRRSPDQVEHPLAAYYIMNDCAYQAPDLYTILATRLQSSLVGLRATLDMQREHRAVFSPRRGHYGRFLAEG
ncbi:Mediator of RNA polymerase II transcription subunit 6 [Malassezia sp. CBS 17886]|nr:Mediator of RNA polymerase II transcription subunit 6 [Malassezia sp. CBS 17886]